MGKDKETLVKLIDAGSKAIKKPMPPLKAKE